METKIIKCLSELNGVMHPDYDITVTKNGMTTPSNMNILVTSKVTNMEFKVSCVDNYAEIQELFYKLVNWFGFDIKYVALKGI